MNLIDRSLSQVSLVALLGAVSVGTACGGSPSSGTVGNGTETSSGSGGNGGSNGGDNGSSNGGGSGSGGSSGGNGGSSGTSSSGSNGSSSGHSSGSSGSTASSGSGSNSSSGAGDTDTTMPPNLPTVSGTCPTFAAGSGTAITVTAGGNTITADVWGGAKSTGSGGPLIVYWHGTSSSPGGEIPIAFDTTALAADGGLIVGFVATSRTGATTGNTGDDVWYQSDAALADQVVACAIRDYNIDPRRIYTAGYSAGGLQTVYMWFARSGYIASVISYSGGDATINAAAKQDASNLPPAIAAHGAMGSDTFVLDFAQASATWESEIKTAGGFSIDCNDGGNHLDFFNTRAPNLKPVAYAFLKAHPFGIKPEPYTSLPSGFPSYCKID